MTSYVQDSFLGGEWSKTSQGRITDKSYRTAMETCLNGYPGEGGYWTRRQGTQWAATTIAGAPGKLFSFNFVETNPYTMELCDGTLRMFAGTNLVTTNDDKTVSTISTASPAKVATSAAHNWATGDYVFFKNLGTYTPYLKNRTFRITVTSSTEFTLVDPLTNLPIDGLTLGTTPPAATIARVLVIATVYTSVDWSTMRPLQANDDALLLTGAKNPYIVRVATDPTSLAYATFTLDAITFKDGPYLDPVPGGVLISPSAASAGLVNLTLSFATWDATRAYAVGDYVTYSAVNYRAVTGENVNLQPDTHTPTNWIAVSAGSAISANGFQASDIGRLMRLYSNPADYASGTTYSLGNSVMYGGVPYRAVVGSNTGNTPGVDPTKWAIDLTAARWTWGRIATLLNVIDHALAGSVTMGNTTNGDNAFDGDTGRPLAGSAYSVASSCYVGKNYSGASDQKIHSAVVMPPIPGGALFSAHNRGLPGLGGFNSGLTVNGSGSAYAASMVTLNLRAKASAPASSSDGTLLGTTGSIDGASGQQLILSNDTTTAWKYVWIELIVDSQPVDAGHSPEYNLGIGEIQYVKPATSGTAADGVTLQILGDPLLNTVAISKFRMGVYSNTTGFPKNGTYHEGRVWFGGVVGNRIDSSVSNGLVGTTLNCAPTNPDGTAAANNGISYIFNAEDVNAIRWMKSEQQGILCGTQAGEWLVQATTQNLALSPTNIQAHRVTRIKCADAEPALAETTMLIIQRFKHKIMEYFADVFSGKFSAPNLSSDASHLATRGLEQIVYQHAITPIAWARCTDGSLLGMTYKRQSLMSSQPPEFKGWHQHTLGTGRTVESLAIGPSAAGYQTDEGALDTVSMITKDPDTGVCHVEFLTNSFEEGTPVTSAWFLDGATSDVNYVEATIGGRTGLTITGLWHLNGETVSVFAGGYDPGVDFLVTNGSCFVPYDTFMTASFVSAFAGSMPVVVGLTYTSRGRLVRPATQLESGTRNGPGLFKQRRNQQFGALFVDTAGISVGTRFTAGKMKPILFRDDAGTAYAPNQLYSGVYWNTLEDTDSLDGMLAWEITRPYPATVAAMGAFLNVKDRA